MCVCIVIVAVIPVVIIPSPPLPPQYGGLFIYWNHFVYVCLSVCSFVCVSGCVLTISPELLNHFLLPNLVWWCIIMKGCVMWKNWFTIFNVKVTAKVQNVSECFLGQSLLIHITFCVQTWYCYAASINFLKECVVHADIFAMPMKSA